MLLSTECFRWFAFLPFIPFKIWNEVLQPAFLAPSSQNIFSLRSFYFQWGKNEVYVEIRHSHYSTPKAEKMTSSHLLHTPRGSQPRQECATCEAFHGMSRERNRVLTVFRKAEHSRGWRRRGILLLNKRKEGLSVLKVLIEGHGILLFFTSVKWLHIS